MKPNPFYSRTPQYIFLETAGFKDGREEICDLYTPFGKVQLLSGGLLSDILSISGIFLETIRSTLVDVTKKIQVYNYVQEDDRKYGPFPLKKEHWPGAGTPTKLYLVQSAESIDIEKSELVFFSSIVLAKGQYERDKAQFQELSEGKNCF
jgi:hypothetical protein